MVVVVTVVVLWNCGTTNTNYYHRFTALWDCLGGLVPEETTHPLTPILIIYYDP